MAKNLEITGEGAEKTDQFGREHSEKLQLWARQLVSSLYMLVRSVKIYELENQLFAKPVEILRETANQIVAKDGQLRLQIVKEAFYVNDMLVKIDLNNLDNARELIAEFRAKDVGGFNLGKPLSAEELRNFLAIFAKDSDAEIEADGQAGRKLVALKLSRWSQIQERVRASERDETVDRKRYALTVYARLIVFMRTLVAYRKVGKSFALQRAGRLIQDLVDICHDQRVHFLGMTTFRDEGEYLVYHSVNVALLAIVFGNELGLTKPQLRDLGMAALFHDIGKADLPAAVTLKKGMLSDDERRLVNRSQLKTLKSILAEGLTRSAMLRLITTFEHSQDFGSAVKDERGGIQMILPKGNLSVFSRILCICVSYDALTSKRPFRDAYGPDVAMLLMWTELRAKFDPELLKVFMKVMAVQPIKLLPKYQQTITLL